MRGGAGSASSLILAATALIHGTSKLMSARFGHRTTCCQGSECAIVEAVTGVAVPA